MDERRPTDDGYRGLLRNTETGQVLYANAETSRMPKYERVLTADQQGTAEVSKTEPLAEEVEEAVEVAVNEGAMAVDDLIKQAKATSDKDELKVLGAQLGVKLTQNMNIETMRDRIEKQAELISSAGE